MKMRQYLSIIFGCLLSQVSLAQTDSVYYAKNTKLLTDIEIVFPQGDKAIREHYTYFKYRYWLGEVDTIPIATLNGTQTKKSKQIVYEKLGVCDSIINEIRNAAQYWEMQSQINAVARVEIGYSNEAFNRIMNTDSNRIKEFYTACHTEFVHELTDMKAFLLNAIEGIKKEKIDRFTNFQTSPEMIDSISIVAFLETFDECEIDFKSLEIMIIHDPKSFIKAINTLSETEFFTFTLKLNNFPENSNVSEMKARLKSVKKNSRRAKMTIQKIRRGKGLK